MCRRRRITDTHIPPLHSLPPCGCRSINFQELSADLAEITFKYPFRIPPYFALIIRYAALSSDTQTDRQAHHTTAWALPSPLLLEPPIPSSLPAFFFF